MTLIVYFFVSKAEDSDFYSGKKKKQQLRDAGRVTWFLYFDDFGSKVS